MAGVVVYSGDGPAVRRAALGHAVEALAGGGRVTWVRFLAGEADPALQALGQGAGDRFVARVMGRERPPAASRDDPVDVRWAEDGVACAARASARGDRTLVVLDDVLAAVGLGLVDVDRVLAVLDGRRPEAEVVLTGAPLPPELIAAADAALTIERIVPGPAGPAPSTRKETT